MVSISSSIFRIALAIPVTTHDPSPAAPVAHILLRSH